MKYQGSYCALITPFKDDKFDEKGFIKIIRLGSKVKTSIIASNIARPVNIPK